MTKSYLLLCAILFVAISLFGQKGKVSGVIFDDQTNETLIGANISVGQGIGTITDFDGKFELELPYGNYDLKVSYVGYNDQVSKLTISAKPVTLKLRLETIILSEVSVVADMARSRETPIAFTTVLPAKIQEQLAGQDIPMVLNSTPGVYATAQGGGDGDARITIRGFSQRNVAVMIDGIPVNDMENGWVYWSNWFGLDAVTSQMQVQRGLSASKLALPSVGGAMNIITKGFDTKKGGNAGVEIDGDGKYRYTLGYNSGKLEGGWAYTLAGSYKVGSSWVEKTETEGYFYYAKIDKRTGNHLTSISAMGAPQWHDQRSYKRATAEYNAKYAEDQGIEVYKKNANGEYELDANGNKISLYPIVDKGINYNQHWGYIRRDAEKWNADSTARIIDSNVGRKELNEQINQFHKPQFSLRDFWTVNDKFSVSNIVYLSVGKGGGSRPRSSIKNNQLVTDPTRDDYGQVDWDTLYNENTKIVYDPFMGPTAPIDITYDPKLYSARYYLVESRNEHYWYGYLGTLNYNLSKELNLSGGIDVRSYRGIHYMEIIDLLGADYVVDKNDVRLDYMTNPKLAMKGVGDKVYYHNDGLVRWGGLFAQAEYKGPMYSTFINVSTATSWVKKVDYFQDKESDWKRVNGGTIKGGFNYNLTENINAFVNAGFISKAREFKYYYVGNTAAFRDKADNEKVTALELGSNYEAQDFSVKLNAYLTRWINKPGNTFNTKRNHPISGEEINVTGDIPGMDARHMGIELETEYKLMEKLELKGLISIGDWIWDKKVKNVELRESNSGELIETFDFDATGIHVGDAAQTQLGASVRWEIIKGLYIMPKITYFDRYFADFSPEATLDPVTKKTRDSWELPSYKLVDIHMGYKKKIKGIQYSLRLNLLNILDEVYVADAVNNDSYHPLSGQSVNGIAVGNSFDGNSATVFFGAPRRMTISFEARF